MGRVGAPHDCRELLERGVLAQAISVEKRIEAAILADVAELCTGYVIGNRAFALGAFEDLIGRHIEEFRRVVDETCDQPRTGDAVDLGTLAGIGSTRCRERGY